MATSMNFVCPVCQTKMLVPTKAKGRKVKCPKCLTKSVAEGGAGGGINKQAVILTSALLAIVVFCAVMMYLN